MVLYVIFGGLGFILALSFFLWYMIQREIKAEKALVKSELNTEAQLTKNKINEAQIKATVIDKHTKPSTLDSLRTGDF